MFIQFRHIEANEVFYYLPSLLGVQYKKVNHGRGQVIGNNGVPYKGRQLFRRFKPSDVVLTTLKLTPENAWMEISDSIVDACPEELQEIRANGERDLV